MHMRLDIGVDMDGALLNPSSDQYDPNELARVLARIAEKVQDREWEGEALDLNGNSVGVYQVTVQPLKRPRDDFGTHTERDAGRAARWESE